MHPIGYHHIDTHFYTTSQIHSFNSFCLDGNPLQPKINHLHLPKRWKYENWRISRDLVCPGSTRYGHKHRSNKRKTQHSESKISLPIPILGSEIRNEILNRPSLSHKIPMYTNSPIWMVPKFLILLIVMLCTPRIISTISNKQNYPHREKYEQEHDTNIRFTGSTHPRPTPSVSTLILSRLFSPPSNWSLTYTMDTCGLHHLSCIVKSFERGISPMYMADPSEPSPPELPEWRIAQLAKQREAQRRYYNKKKVIKVKVIKVPVPGAIRTQKCRQRKNQIQPIPETDIPTNDR